MNLINHTSMAAGYTTIHNQAGSECLVVVVKATYRLPYGGEAVELMQEQLAVTLADTATGEPGLSAPEYECDYCLEKPRVDILLLGSAYAPKGIPAREVPVGLRVGTMTKAFKVYGKRYWKAHLLGAVVGMTKPEPFTKQTISYDIAYGGTETGPKRERKRLAYARNPVGCGYNPHTSFADGLPVAQTESPTDPVTSPAGSYAPMAFGPLGRNWAQRARYAGTYDAHWQDNVFPFLPEDFDARFFQSAPEDQQLPEIVGGELVILANLTHPALTPSGRLQFHLPDLNMNITLTPKEGVAEQIAARADTLLIEPDNQRFTIVWRITKDLHNDILRYKAIEIGERPKGHVIRIPLEVLLGELPSQRGSNLTGGA
ncbi:DUF2169 family type VI secretion system accessory protein [Massilia scottii]|uniref:DUF2169 family type VI secretion system accessory protein n=1 Tax=Massilia scottii TaxID=3057166 RepID=UPI002796A551|nr:DUF2169 domain-containing protein [Massilia sp. CCM 9029]MDQ1829720.1 DUF2169 domain-containing protein [Massilia sp. CCM 9029]